MMRGRGVLGALGGVVCASGMIALLAWVANELPRPLGTAARTSERLWQVTAKRDRLPGLTGPERKAVTTLAPHLDGMIVWSSNRGGHHDLYLINLRTRSVRQLTRAPSVSFFSRFSPDGRQIVFVRSQREWVSARDPTAWDVYLIQVDGTSERRIAVGAYHPTWTADGKGIIFHRETRVFRYDLATRQETMILDVARAVPGIDNDAGDVELAPDGRRFGFVLRGTFSGAHGLTGAFSGAAVFDPGTRKLTLLAREQACQTTWAPDGHSLLWMETGGNGGTHVMTGQADGADRRVFMDLPGRYSHEYFPKLSNDGRWLIWAAAAEGHEQDQADYEIFVWKTGTPWDQAVRLTYHSGNDNWPDLWVRPHD
jgi:Tol biopolymer transport system component